jgi:hypothetical protein
MSNQLICRHIAKAPRANAINQSFVKEPANHYDEEKKFFKMPLYNE